jgi:2-succinyl-6-hydroxy-2,4-cyclohexadiene-1-carboxylate synthase
MRCTLLHGFAGDPSAWDAVIAAWSSDVEPVAIALPGHGGGPVRDGWDATLDAIDCERVVIGYSLGARTALGLLARGRCDRAVLISVNPGIADGERAARRASDAKWTAMLRTGGMAAFVDAWQAQALFATQATRVPADVLAARRTRRLQHDPEQLARSLEHMGLAAMPDLRAHVTGPLIVGADDAKFVAIARATSLPVTVIAGSGHDPTLEQPRALAAALADAL